MSSPHPSYIHQNFRVYYRPYHLILAIFFLHFYTLEKVLEKVATISYSKARSIRAHQILFLSISLCQYKLWM